MKANRSRGARTSVRRGGGSRGRGEPRVCERLDTMVYSKILELSSLGAGYPYGPVDYDDGAGIVANITRKAVSKGPSIPETYAGYDNSVCFVEPMVRALDRPRPVGCYSDWRPASDVSACRAANLREYHRPFLRPVR